MKALIDHSGNIGLCLFIASSELTGKQDFHFVTVPHAPAAHPRIHENMAARLVGSESVSAS